MDESHTRSTGKRKDGSDRAMQSTEKQKYARSGTNGPPMPRWAQGKNLSQKNSASDMRAFVERNEQPLPVLMIDGRDTAHSKTTSAGESPRVIPNESGAGDVSKEPERFQDDQMESDNEHKRDTRERFRDSELNDVMETVMESLYNEVLKWIVHEYGKANLVDGNADWVDYWGRTIGRNVLKNAAYATDAELYRNHWSPILLMEARAGISSALRKILPALFRHSDKFVQELYKKQESGGVSLLRFIIRKVSHSRMLTNLTTDSSDVKLNTDIAREMAGMTVCVGFMKKDGLEGDGSHLPLSLCLCRSVHVEGEDVDHVGSTGKIDYIRAKVCFNRKLTSSFKPGEEDSLYLIPMYSLAPIARMFQALSQLSRLPTDMRRMLYELGGRRLHCAPTQRAKDDSFEGIDAGCVKYLQKCLALEKHMNKAQLNAVCEILRGIGRGENGRLSWTLVMGPPATGKTTCISHILGSVIHHSVAGHMGMKQHNVLSADDGAVRCSISMEALRVLVCSGSNQGTCNVMRRILNEGIPDGDGGKLFPRMVRIARYGLDLQDLEEHSMNKSALVLDNELYHKEEKDTRTSASSKARKALARECVVFFMTLSLSGSARLSELRVPIDLILIDEAAQAWEPEVLVPIVASRRRSKLGRVHVGMFGDPKQLTALTLGVPLLKDCGVQVPCYYEDHVRSLFERLQVQRCAQVVMLNEQYRMHSTIAKNVLPIVYKGYEIRNSTPDSKLAAPYNKGKTGFSPLTVVDTSVCKGRNEEDGGDGMIRNGFEVQVIDRVLRQIRECCSTEEWAATSISLIAPYNAQVDMLDAHVRSVGWMRDNKIKVSTVDSMQGRETDVVIFSGTRSNRKHRVGFLRNENRLKVSLTRGMKLLVIVGDVGTLCDGAIQAFNDLIDNVRRGAHGAEIRKWNE